MSFSSYILIFVDYFISLDVDVLDSAETVESRAPTTPWKNRHLPRASPETCPIANFLPDATGHQELDPRSWIPTRSLFLATHRQQMCGWIRLLSALPMKAFSCWVVGSSLDMIRRRQINNMVFEGKSAGIKICYLPICATICAQTS